MIFNSRDEFYKSPLGPVKNNTTITYRLKFPLEFEARNVFLCIAKDGEDFEYISMSNYQNDDNTNDYELNYTIDLGVAPYWYYFKLDTAYGERFISKQGGGEGKLWDVPLAFQQTVYDEDYKIPNWFGEGIMYNIFPDRFNRSRVPKKLGERVIHKEWDEMPVFEPDEKGEILNNDFFGGNFKGISSKLDYLKSLNVTVIYFNPIFKAYSNHRYDTGDYNTIDPYIGTEKEFQQLCQKAKKKGIRIILDGVFSHTGFDSKYFNGKNTYDSVGAYNSKQSPYYDWFHFEEWNSKYASWWGMYTLPEVNEMNEKFMNYVIKDEDSVINKWIGLGASGYRLDVADELPDEFIYELNKTAKAKNEEAFIIGEVWEDASNKESYSYRRKYVYGQYLDSVMNYVLKDAVIDYMKYGYAQNFREAIEVMKENYPKDFFHALMNIVGTHDTPRILTTLVGDHFDDKKDRAFAKLTDEQREKGISLLKLTSLIQYTMVGCPCLYYGDEAGMEGYEDPLNRGTYPWGNENLELLEWYKYLGELRSKSDVLKKGDIKFLYAEGDILAYRRSYENEHLDIYINRSEQNQEVPMKGEIVTLEKYSYKIIKSSEL